MLDEVIALIDDGQIKYEKLKYLFVPCGVMIFTIYPNDGNVFNIMKIIVEKLCIRKTRILISFLGCWCS